MSTSARTIWVGYALVASLLASSTSAADTVFQKRSADGTVVFSDAPLNSRGQRMAYTSNFGRETATESCAGQTPASLEARRNNLEAQFAEAAQLSGVELDLLHAVARVESCFDPKANSRAGARGVMQLMPATARELGVNNILNARENIIGGARYLERMLDLHNGDIKLALASYNAGPGAVKKHGGIPPYPETIRYVELVTKQLSANQGNRSPN